MEASGSQDRLEALERQHREQIARANAALAAAQDRSYWLDRWNVDLNAVMRRRGASELRAGLRALRAVYRRLTNRQRAWRNLARQAPAKVDATRRSLAEDRSRAVRAALASAGLEQRDGDVWLRADAGDRAPLDHLDELRHRLAPGARVVLEAGNVSPGRLLVRTTPDWWVALYLQGDPDVYVLELR